jgi:hypothetical protein
MNRNAIYMTAVVALSGIGVLADEQPQTKSQTSLSNVSYTQSLADDYAGKFGLGIMLGEPTGLSGKYWLNDTLAVDGAAGWSFYDNSEFYLHSDLLVHKFDLLPVQKGKLPFYVGAGAFVRFRDEHHDNEAGIRVPVGLDYLFEGAPVDIFVEFAPGIDLTPATRADFSGGIGIRYWF